MKVKKIKPVIAGGSKKNSQEDRHQRLMLEWKMQIEQLQATSSSETKGVIPVIVTGRGSKRFKKFMVNGGEIADENNNTNDVNTKNSAVAVSGATDIQAAREPGLHRPEPANDPKQLAIAAFQDYLSANYTQNDKLCAVCNADVAEIDGKASADETAADVIAAAVAAIAAFAAADGNAADSAGRIPVLPESIADSDAIEVSESSVSDETAANAAIAASGKSGTADAAVGPETPNDANSLFNNNTYTNKGMLKKIIYISPFIDERL